jgi:hypothetical protein
MALGAERLVLGRDSAFQLARGLAEIRTIVSGAPLAHFRQQWPVVELGLLAPVLVEWFALGLALFLLSWLVASLVSGQALAFARV